MHPTFQTLQDIKIFECMFGLALIILILSELN